MGTSAGMIQQARMLLGTSEHPPGSNHNAVTEWYAEGNMPWCNIAITFEAGHSDNLHAIGGRFASTVVHARSFQARGRWHYGLGGARPGDVVFMDWSGSRSIAAIDHVGLIEVVHADGTVTTLEGNTADVFARRRRGPGCVVGYGRPAYDDAAALPRDDGLLRRGSTGAAVRKLQENLNRILHAGLLVDGDFGPATAAALQQFQARFHIEVDGEYGPESAAAVQAALVGRATPIRPTPLVPAAGPLTVDGVFGADTCAALQRALSTHGVPVTVDGAFGPQTTRALQALLGVAADGEIGPRTIRALQHRLGAPEDGEWGPETTRFLQRALNANAF